MNELELIARLTRGLPVNDSVVIGAGDDCAALSLGGGDDLVLFKTDAVVEGVHFESGAPPEKIGHKALGRVLSDVAAMGGKPGSVLVTLGLPEGFDPERVERVYRGLAVLAERFGVAVVGGETVLLPGRMMLSIALIGTVARGRCVRRCGAGPGDAIMVSGTLGGSLAGRHLEFEPRVREGAWLASRFTVHSMIDLSDGLAGDLPHLLTPGGWGADLLTSAIPVSVAARARARTGVAAKPALLAALTDGEDFELLFTVASTDAVAVMDGWRAEFPEVRLSCIGKVKEEPGIRLVDQHGVRLLQAHGYAHFR